MQKRTAARQRSTVPVRRHPDPLLSIQQYSVAEEASARACVAVTHARSAAITFDNVFIPAMKTTIITIGINASSTRMCRQRRHSERVCCARQHMVHPPPPCTLR
eukprot:TRINITY_DN16928_c0_g1_i1.p1 TRINITY_DN16928_c0_g1~~TRINITY_DN16928_c0_g1_i1.p1  ORF type:complete len:104 (+),score=3.24 TRINITY_DN16928_c0_g1_i1:122-433(+)